jgi:PKD repeat protein
VGVHRKVAPIFIYRAYNFNTMAIPVANFTFITNGLTAFFQDSSTETPTSWLWDFGDTNTSTSQSPNHTYAASGNYSVSLIATNGDGASTAYIYEIKVNEAQTTSIDDIILFESPPSITLDQNTKNYLLNKWRLYLQAAFKIGDEYLNDEAQYQFLHNVLLAKLVIYDIILIEAKKYLASTMNGGGTSSGGVAGGNIKKIETGPTNAEWYSGSETLAKLFAVNKNGVSPFDEITQDVCHLSGRLKIKLPMCKSFVSNPFVPLKADVESYISSTDYLNEHYGN